MHTPISSIVIHLGLLLGAGCTAEGPRKEPNDARTPTSEDSALVDTDTDTTPPTTDDTAPPVILPDHIEAPEAVLTDALSPCTATAPPAFEVSYVGASPHVASVPIAMIDGVVNGADVAAEGFCLEQTFADGGQLTRCGRTDIQGASAYLQGAPAPGQLITLRLGVLQGDELCWASEEHVLALGEVPAPGFDYAPLEVPLSTPDYPPAAISPFNVGDQAGVYAMALMDSPAFGLRAGDVLWSLDTTDYGTPIVEVRRLVGGLLAFSTENDGGSDTHEIYDPTFPGVKTAAVDAAGFEWLNVSACTDASAPDCVGFVHHGNATLPGSDVVLTMNYERLHDDSGEPYLYADDDGFYYLIGASFQGHSFDHHGALERRFGLSFHDLYDMDPSLSTTHGPRIYEGPAGERNRTAYYVNSADVVQDADDPALYHLTGTVTVRPYNGFYHLTLTADGEVVDKTLYNNLNTALTWDNRTNQNPLDTNGHSAEFLGRDADGRPHFLVYDRSSKIFASAYSKCAAFYHVMDDGGEMTVGGPYHNRVATEEDGEICGNSMSYGNAGALHDVNIDGYEAPVHLIASFDNVALPSDNAGAWVDHETIYAAGTPRLLGLYLNEERFDPDSWRTAAHFLGRNIEGNDPVGFSSLIDSWPAILVADSPFLLRGL